MGDISTSVQTVKRKNMHEKTILYHGHAFMIITVNKLNVIVLHIYPLPNVNWLRYALGICLDRHKIASTLIIIQYWYINVIVLTCVPFKCINKLDTGTEV